MFGVRQGTPLSLLLSLWKILDRFKNKLCQIRGVKKNIPGALARSSHIELISLQTILAEETKSKLAPVKPRDLASTSRVRACEESKVKPSALCSLYCEPGAVAGKCRDYLDSYIAETGG